MSTNICNTCRGSACPANCNGGGSGNKNSSNWIIIVIILVLLGVLLVMAFIVAFDLYKKTQKANEPKNITVNKHIHSIKSPAIVVSAPQIMAPPAQVARPVAAVVSRVVPAPSVEVRSFQSPVSYEVRSFQSPVPEVRSFRAPEMRVPEVRSFRVPDMRVPEVRSFRMPEMSSPVDFQAADFELPNDIVSYDGFNLDDVAYSPSAPETPCENR